MPVKIHIEDPHVGNAARVTDDNSLFVSLMPAHAHELGDALLRQKVYRAFLTNTADSSALNVDGSTTTQKFAVRSEVGKTKFVTHLRIHLEDEQMDLSTSEFRRFGGAAGAPGLTNGLLLYAVQGGTTTQLWPTAVKNIGDFLDTANDYVNLINAISAGVDYLSIDFHLPIPVPLTEGSGDSLTCEIRDNLSTVNLFNIIVDGYQEVV